MTYRHLILGPTRKKRLKQVATDFAVQAAHAIDRTTAVDSQIGHVEAFRPVVRILPPKSQKIAHGYP